MASKNIGTLTLDLVAKVGGFVDGMGKAGRATAKWRKQAMRDVKRVGAAMTKALVASAVAVSAALVVTVNASRKTIDEQAKLARSIGGTVKGMDALARSGSLAGVSTSELTGAATRLNAKLGEAIVKGGPAADALDRLGLSADKLSKMDVDERFQAIAVRMQQMGLSTQVAAAELRELGIRQSSVTGFILEGGEAIDQSRAKLEAMGVSLSDIDAAKVEAMNDSFTDLELLADGFGKQLTVAVAPAIQLVTDRLAAATIEAGGMGNVGETAFDKITTSAAFVIDAIDGVKVSTRSLVDLLIAQKALSDGAGNALLENFFNSLNSLPGVNFVETQGSFAANAALNFGIMEEAIAGARDKLETPLAGQAFLAELQKAKREAQALAEITVSARRVDLPDGGGVTQTDEERKAAEALTKSINNQIEALQLQAYNLHKTADEMTLLKLAAKGATPEQLKVAAAALANIDAFEKSNEVQKEYRELVQALRTDEEQLTDEMRSRLAVLDAINKAGSISSAEFSDGAARIAGAATQDAPEFAGLAPEVGGAFGELAKIDKAQSELEDWYTTQLDMLAEFRAERADLNDTWDAEELALKQQHDEKIAEIDQARAMAQMAAGEQVFGDLASASRAFFGEQSALYKAAFAVEKAYAIGKALLNVPKAYSDAFAAVVGIPVIGPALAPIAGATAAAAQVAQAASIGSVGMAHDGMDAIPKTGSWILEKGERVVTSETSAKLDKTLSDIQNNRSEGGKKGADRSANVTFQIQANDATGFEDMLGRSRGMIISVINEALNDQGRESLA